MSENNLEAEIAAALERYKAAHLAELDAERACHASAWADMGAVHAYKDASHKTSMARDALRTLEHRKHLEAKASPGTSPA